MSKLEAAGVVESLMSELIPLTAHAADPGKLIVRAQHTSLPDDSSLLEGLRESLKAS